MSENASGFVDYGQFSGLNREEDDRLMQEAMARAEAADAASQTALRRVSRDAEGKEADLTKVGSYSDFLKAKQDAAKAWAAVTASTGDLRTDAMRGTRAAGVKSAQDASAAALGADFTRRAGQAATSWSELQKYKAEREAAAGREKADKEAESAKTLEQKRAQLASLGDPMKWQQLGMTPQDVQARMQQWLRLNAEVGSTSPWSEQGKVARQLAWAPDPGIKDQGNPFAGESRWRPEEGMGNPDEMTQANIRGGGNYLTEWDKRLGYGDTTKWKG